MNAMAHVKTVPAIGVGIDTARYGHHVTFLREDRQPAAPAMTVTESSDGYDKLRAQLRRLHTKHPEVHFHVRIDAAGQYAINLERFLRGLALPMTISVGEPKRNKDYHHAVSPKRRTDTTESHAMARYALVEQPRETPQIPDTFYLLREIASRLQGAVRDSTRAINRLHNVLARVFPELAAIAPRMGAAWVLTLLEKYPSPERIANARLASLQKIPYLRDTKASAIQLAAKKTVGTLRGELAEALVRQSVGQVEQRRAAVKELEKLLLQAYQALPSSGHLRVESIPGVGPVTAAILVAKIISIDRFETPEHLVGYFGVFPEEATSGVDRYGNPTPPGTMHMSAKGCDLVRRYLWSDAISGIQWNPALRALYARLRAKGTRGDVALGHCMRKLLHLIFAVWKTDTPFDKTHYNWQSPRNRSTDGDTQTPQAAEESSTDQQETAGHKRDVLPERKVVTAATSSVKAPAPSVKKPTRRPDPCRGSIDYPYLREQIAIEQVLRRLGYWDHFRGWGNQRRGPCPVHGEQREGSRSCAVHLTKHVFRCFHPDCAAQGNVLDLWAMAHRLPLYEAALHLAQTFQLQINRGTEKRNP